MQSSMHSPNMYGNESMHANLQVCLCFKKWNSIIDHLIFLMSNLQIIKFKTKNYLELLGMPTEFAR